jgi:hypothetical protein
MTSPAMELGPDHAPNHAPDHTAVLAFGGSAGSVQPLIEIVRDLPKGSARCSAGDNSRRRTNSAAPDPL